MPFYLGEEHALYFGFAYNLLRSSMRGVRECHRQDVDDILQDAYLGFLQQAEKGVILHSRTYFFEILRHRCYRYMRGLGSRELRSQDLVDESAAVDSIEVEFLTAENQERQRNALRASVEDFLAGPDWKRGMQNIGVVALSAREKEVLVLFLAGHHFKDIAGLMSIDAKTVYSHYSGICRKIKASHPVDVVKYGIREGLTAA